MRDEPHLILLNWELQSPNYDMTVLTMLTKVVLLARRGQELGSHAQMSSPWFKWVIATSKYPPGECRYDTSAVAVTAKVKLWIYTQPAASFI